MNTFKRYLTFWVDEFIRIQNERQWKKWREATKKANQSLLQIANHDQKENYLIFP